MKWIIEDWAGNRMFPDKEFDDYEDAWGFLYETVTTIYPNLKDDELDEQFGEYFVLPKKLL